MVARWPGNLVGAGGGGQPGADVDELADTALGRQMAHYPGQERPVRPRPGHHLRAAADHFLGGFPVGLIVVFAAQPVAIHPGRMRHQGVKPGARIGVLGF
jgi:hypothetical protein